MAGRDGASDERGRLVSDPFDYRIAKDGGGDRVARRPTGDDGRRELTPAGSPLRCSAPTTR